MRPFFADLKLQLRQKKKKFTYPSFKYILKSENDHKLTTKKLHRFPWQSLKIQLDVSLVCVDLNCLSLINVRKSKKWKYHLKKRLMDYNPIF